jgi:sugar lactone lactonase YvrE
LVQPVLDDVRFIGRDLVRAECVLATRRGDLYTADWRGGVAHIRPDGSQQLYHGQTLDIPEGLRPNGIALEPDGSFLFANLGTDIGGVWRLTRAGQVTPVLVELGGEAIPPSNFVMRDHDGRLWLTVSTRLRPRSLDYRADAATGFVVLLDESGARIVADGLGFTNECAIDPSGQYLYVVETYGRRLSRFPLAGHGALGPKEVVTEFGYGQFPDGLAFDQDGNIWIAGVISNQLLHVEAGTGKVTTVLEDSNPEHVAWVEGAYRAGELGRPHMDQIQSKRLRNISSIAFGGPDLRTAFLGCLLGDQVASVRLATAGVPPPHWTY